MSLTHAEIHLILQVARDNCLDRMNQRLKQMSLHPINHIHDLPRQDRTRRSTRPGSHHQRRLIGDRLQDSLDLKTCRNSGDPSPALVFGHENYRQTTSTKRPWYRKFARTYLGEFAGSLTQRLTTDACHMDARRRSAPHASVRIAHADRTSRTRNLIQQITTPQPTRSPLTDFFPRRRTSHLP